MLSRMLPANISFDHDWLPQSFCHLLSGEFLLKQIDEETPYIRSQSLWSKWFVSL